MEKRELSIPGVYVLTPKVFGDNRGYYMESYSKRTMEELGFDIDFVQDNHSKSMKKGTIRGLHFQNNPKAQAKLVRCTRGRIMDYAVDLRKDSPTYKKYIKVELTEENKEQIFIPRGFGHLFVTLTDDVEVQYKVDELYYPEYDRSIAYNDPEIGLDLDDIEDPTISEKDRKAPLLKDSDVNF